MDPKRVTFNHPAFQSAVAAHLDGPILYGLDDALPCIERLIEEMEERYRIFEQANVSELNEFEMACSQSDQMARRILVIDEFQDLTIDSKVSRALLCWHSTFGRQSSRRGHSCHLTTQRPDRNTVPSVIKANLGGKIALRVANAINSRVILDQGGAEGLLGNGDLLADLGHGLVRAQAPVLAV